MILSFNGYDYFWSKILFTSFIFYFSLLRIMNKKWMLQSFKCYQNIKFEIDTYSDFLTPSTPLLYQPIREGSTKNAQCAKVDIYLGTFIVIIISIMIYNCRSWTQLWFWDCFGLRLSKFSNI